MFSQTIICTTHPMSERSSSNCGQDQTVKLFGNPPRLFAGSIRRSASMGHLTNHAGSNHEDGYISQDIDSGRQRRKGGVGRTEEASVFPSEDDDDDVMMMTEEELNGRVEAIIKKFYSSQMQKTKPVEAPSPITMTEEELNTRVEAFLQKFYSSQMQKRMPLQEPWWRLLDFTALKQSPVSFFSTEETKARRRAAKDDSDGGISIDILPETDDSDAEAHHRRDGHSTARKVFLDRIFVVGNLVLELPSAVFDQLSSLHKPQYALLSMVTSLVAIVICVIELVLKGREGGVAWRWRAKKILPWLYYPGGQGNNKPFATFTDIIGLVCAIFQGIFTSITYAFYCRHTDSPVKISAWPLVFAFGLLCSKFYSNPETKAIPHKSQD